MNLLSRLKSSGLKLKSGITQAEMNKNHGQAVSSGWQLRSDNITAEPPMKKAKAMRKPKWLAQVQKDRANKEHEKQKLDGMFEKFVKRRNLGK